jgi:hypothetical protein
MVSPSVAGAMPAKYSNTAIVAGMSCASRFAQAASCLLRFGEGELLVACLDALRDGAEQFAALFVGTRCPVGEGACSSVYGGVQFRLACDGALGDDLAVGGVAHFVARACVYPFTVDVESVGLHRCVSLGGEVA